MSDIPDNIKNHPLYTVYLSFLEKVVTSYDSLLNEIWQLKKSRETLAYDPYLQSLKADLIRSGNTEDLRLEEQYINDDISLNRIVSFLIEGLYAELKNLKEYQDCINVMDSDMVIKNQVNKSLSFLGTHQTMRHWTYLSHFLKSMIFKYFETCSINRDYFNQYLRDLESFFHQDQLEVIRISPLHYFQLVSSSNGNLIRQQEPVILSEALRIRPVTREDRIRFWSKFPISHLDKSFEGINYFIEYNFKTTKSFDGTQDQTIPDQPTPIQTSHIFSTITTLFRLVGVHCGLLDTTTTTKLDLPIQGYSINLFVSSLGVAYNTHPYVSPDTLSQFKGFWNKYGDLLIRKVLNDQRFDDDPFGNLKVSINRFNAAFERKDGIDAFIDNVVALEALFSKKGDKPPPTITERLLKRLAIFLETDPSKREDLFCDMRNLYRQRNEIIHGGYTKEYDIVETRKYLIRSFLKYFEFLKLDSFYHADFIRILDSNFPNITKKYNDCL